MKLEDTGMIAFIQAKGYNFLITDKPSHYPESMYIDMMKRYHVSGVVRVCDPPYDTAFLTGAGLDVYSLVYEDGMYPPRYVIDKWFEIVKKHFQTDPDACLAVHCVAGLGRAPVLVAVALIELGMKYEDAVKLIRSRKRGAMNTKQLRFLEKYRRSRKLKPRGWCRVQ